MCWDPLTTWTLCLLSKVICAQDPFPSCLYLQVPTFSGSLPWVYKHSASSLIPSLSLSYSLLALSFHSVLVGFRPSHSIVIALVKVTNYLGGDTPSCQLPWTRDPSVFGSIAHSFLKPSLPFVPEGVPSPDFPPASLAAPPSHWLVLSWLFNLYTWSCPRTLSLLLFSFSSLTALETSPD